MTLIQLRHFMALAETGSFRRAAELVNLTQPALTRSIQSLEEDMGQRLFERIGRHTELTPLGKALKEDVRTLVDDADYLKDRARAIINGEMGAIRIGMGPMPSKILTAPLLRYMSTNHPGVRVECHVESTESMLESLKEHRLDVLVIATLLMPLSNDFRIEPIAALQGGAFMCREGHPLQARKSLSFDEICHYPIAALTMLNERIANYMVDSYGPAAHPDNCVSLRSNQFEPLIELASSSDTILFGVRGAALELVELPVKPAMKDSGLFGLVSLARSTEHPLLPTVRGLVTRLLQELPT
ncbi:hypothetical protein HR45_13200 [Shewanella mangrovi]|uniref:HTH lysR-type domain-containing protein n=1 Tax=Shewanella mangrovi TaxID=1515746 RepID=A0A094JX47_9GAMM|nr:LysR family transcriptional regulator [Shewanella mangrovi]KFZ36996.1 hypothetical protein HR45_13200 [Shewanella mangrovi]